MKFFGASSGAFVVGSTLVAGSSAFPGAMLDLALGVALYAQPPHVKFPGLAAVAIARSFLRKRRRESSERRESGPDESSDAESPSPGVELRWRNLTSTLRTKGDDAPRLILSEVSGSARPGRFLALLGPSGSGKTSLLNALAAQTPEDRRLRLSGAVTANGVAVDGGDAHRARVAYVRQQDVFYSELTVRETLTAAAKMRETKFTLDKKTTETRVAETLRAVGLAPCADARVGDQKTNGGISGGERKRLALACELVGDARDIVCADEPTSGLDAFQAQRVVGSLKKLCGGVTADDAADAADEASFSEPTLNPRRRRPRCVIASIHQPRGSIVSMFDDVCVLARGRVLYCGPLSEHDACAEWFKREGFPIPANANPAEFLVDLASVDATDAESEARSVSRVDALCDSWAAEGVAFLESLSVSRESFMTKIASPFKAISARANGSAASLALLENDADDARADEMLAETSFSKKTKKRSEKKKRMIRERAGFLGQLALLAKRSWRQVRRDGRTNRVRLITSLNSAAVFGSIFWKLGLGQSTIQDRCGLLQVSAINAAMAALMKTITSFTAEKTIVDRERASGAYDVAPYLIGKILAESPAGAFFPLCFGAVVYPMAGLNTGLNKGKKVFFLTEKFARFAATIVVESFASSAMGLAVSAVAPSTEAAVAMGPAVMVMFIVFGGYYVNAENVPFAFRWITKCSLIKHAFAGLCVNEFEGLDFEASKDGGLRGDTKHGEEVLERLGFGAESSASCLRKQLDVLGFCYALTLYALEKNAPRFQRIERIEELLNVELLNDAAELNDAEASTDDAARTAADVDANASDES